MTGERKGKGRFGDREGRGSGGGGMSTMIAVAPAELYSYNN